MKTVLLGMGLFSHYSDILRSPLAKVLAEHYKIIVLTTHLDRETAEREGFPLHPNIIYRKISVENPRLWGFSNKYIRHAFIREYDRWFITQHWYYRPTHPFAIRFLTRIGSLFPRRFPSAEFFTKLEGLLARPSGAFENIYANEAPVLLITATPGYTPLEAELIVYARKKRLQTLAININYDNAYSQAKFVRKTDFIFVWNERMKKEIAASHHYDPTTIRITGCLRFDHYFSDPQESTFKKREVFFSAKGLDPKKPLIVFTGPSPIMYPPRKEFVSALLALKEKHLLVEDPNILIRLHPHDFPEVYEPFRNIPGVRIEQAGKIRITDPKIKGQKVEMDEESLINLTETIRYADVVINYVSTMIIEASIFDKPIISIGFPEKQRVVNEYEFNKALVDSQCLRLAESPDALGTWINEYLKHPERDRENRKKVVREYVFFEDGHSWKRTSDGIDELMKYTTSHERPM